MPDVFQVYDVTCAPGVPSTLPTVVVLPNSSVLNLTAVTIVIPDGHAGLTGIALGFAGNAVIPFNAGAYISGNNEVIPYVIKAQPPGVTWSAFLCNNDVIPHTWEVRMSFDIIAASTAAPVTVPLDTTDLQTAVADASTGA
jgi:hypothetical protein